MSIPVVMHRVLMGLTLALVVFATPPARGDSPFDVLLSQIPPETNMLVMIDPEQIRRSAFMKQLGDANNIVGGENHHIVPPKEITQVVLAAKIRGFRESMTDWQTALLRVQSQPSITGLAANYGGSIEQLGNIEYAVLPFGAAAVPTSSKTLAVLTPADNQRISRAIQLGRSTKPALMTPYLDAAAQRMALGSDAIICLDLEYLFSKSKILAYLNSSKTFSDKSKDSSAALKMLGTITGLTLRLSFKTDVQAELAFDFNEQAAPAESWGKDLLLEILSDTGAMIEDVANWKVATKDKRFTMTGSLSPTGLRQLFSLLNFPTEVSPGDDPANMTTEQLRQLTAKKTYERFKSTQKLLNDLFSNKDGRQSGSGEKAMWYDKYAQRIESLPTLHVDDEMIAYCDDVVLRLRVQATRFKMVGIKAGAFSQNPNYFNQYFGSAYGGRYFGGVSIHSQVNVSESDFAVVKRVEHAAAAGDNASQMQAIKEETTKIRRDMTAKYQIEF